MRTGFLKWTLLAVSVVLFIATQMTAEFLYRASWDHHDKLYGEGQGSLALAAERVEHATALESIQSRFRWTFFLSVLAAAVTLFIGFRDEAVEWTGVMIAVAIASFLGWVTLGLSIMDDDVPEQRPYSHYLVLLVTIAMGASLAAGGLGIHSKRMGWMVAGSVALVGGLALSISVLSSVSFV